MHLSLTTDNLIYELTSSVNGKNIGQEQVVCQGNKQCGCVFVYLCLPICVICVSGEGAEQYQLSCL